MHHAVISVIYTLVRPEQYKKAYSPIFVTLSGMAILVSPVHPLNANSPMLVTLFGMSIFVRLVQS